METKLYKKQLYKKAQFWARVLARLPGVASIFLSGSMALDRVTKNSDIDFFVIAYPGRIAMARFFVAGLLKVFRQLADRPEHHAGKICPNHYITTENLEIEEKDRYSARLFAHNQFLAGNHFFFREFREKNKDWITALGFEFCPDSESQISKTVREHHTNFLGDRFERWAWKWQQKKLRQNAVNLPPGAKVWIRPNEIRLHPVPKNQFCADGTDVQ
jgi:predicted nucleotidyltransferase